MDQGLLSHILSALGCGAVLAVGFSRWLGSVWAKRIALQEKAKLEKELEIEKARLQENIEVLKSKLAIQVNILQQRYNSINQKRIDAIIENYKLLAKSWLACRYAIQPDEIGRNKPPEKELLEQAAKSLDQYFQHFEMIRIFLSENTQKIVYEFLFHFWQSLNELKIFSESSEAYEKKLEKLYNKWIHDLKPKMDNTRKSIELEYKNLIGIDST